MDAGEVLPQAGEAGLDLHDPVGMPVHLVGGPTGDVVNLPGGRRVLVEPAFADRMPVEGSGDRHLRKQDDETDRVAPPAAENSRSRSRRDRARNHRWQSVIPFPGASAAMSKKGKIR
jgi:hypothetical protein